MIPASAFSAASMQSQRWLLGGKPKQSVAGTMLDMLTMDEDAQLLFMNRVLKKFNLENAMRTSSKQILRLDPAKWDQEASFMCMASKILRRIPDIIDFDVEKEQLNKSLEKLCEGFLDGPLS